MRKALFLIHLSYKGIMKEKKRYVVICISFALGMLLPCMFFANTIPSIEAIGAMHNVREENIKVYQALVPRHQNLMDAISDLSSANVAYSVRASYSPLINMRERSLLIEGIDEHYDSIEAFELREGRLLSPDEFSSGSPVCLLEADYALNPNMPALSAGDDLIVEGETYSVVGIVESYAMQGAVIVPLETFFGMPSRPYYYSNIYIVGADSEQLFVIERILQQSLNIDSGKDAEVIVAETLDNSTKSSALTMLLGFAALLFAALNILQISYGILRGKLFTYGVYMANGMSTGTAYACFYFDNALPMIAAIPVMVLMINLVLHTVPYSFAMRLSLNVYVATVLSGLVTCAVLAGILVRKMRRLTVSALLRERRR